VAELGDDLPWGNAMAHLATKKVIARANTALLLTLVWGGLGVCAFGAVVFDIGRLFDVW
jgi:hypothetical protein